MHDVALVRFPPVAVFSAVLLLRCDLRYFPAVGEFGPDGSKQDIFSSDNYALL